MDSEDLLDHISKKFPDIFDKNRDINFDNILKLPDKYKLEIFDNIDLVYEFIEKEPGIFPELSPRLKNDKEVLLHAAKCDVNLLNDKHVKPIKDLELAFEIAKHGGIEFLDPSLKNSKELAIKIYSNYRWWTHCREFFWFNENIQNDFEVFETFFTNLPAYDWENGYSDEYDAEGDEDDYNFQNRIHLDTIIKAMHKNGLWLEHFKQSKYKENYDICVAAIKSNPFAAVYAPKSFFKKDTFKQELLSVKNDLYTSSKIKQNQSRKLEFQKFKINALNLYQKQSSELERVNILKVEYKNVHSFKNIYNNESMGFMCAVRGGRDKLKPLARNRNGILFCKTNINTRDGDIVCAELNGEFIVRRLKYSLSKRFEGLSKKSDFENYISNEDIEVQLTDDTGNIINTNDSFKIRGKASVYTHNPNPRMRLQINELLDRMLMDKNIFFKVKNNSMRSEFIYEGSYLTIMPCETYENSDIVIAEVNGEFICRKLKMNPLRLESNHKDFLPIEINCSNVVGIVQSCVTFL